MHAVAGTIGNTGSDDVTVEITLTLRTNKAAFKEGAVYEDFATALGSDLFDILDNEFAAPFRAAASQDVEVGVRSRVL